MDFRVFPWVCSTEPCNLVSSLGYLVSNERRVLLGGIRLGGFATKNVYTIGVILSSLTLGADSVKRRSGEGRRIQV